MTRTRVPLNIFGVGFGLAGLATTWRIADTLGLAPAAVATVIALIAAVVWLLSVGFYLRGVTAGEGTLRRDLRDMTLGPFASLAIIVPLLLVVDGLEPYAPQVARALVDVLIVAVLVVGGWFTGFWMRGGTEIDRLHPGYFLPTVAGGFIASAAAAEVGQVRLSQIMFGLGLVCWMVVGSIILGRLVFRPGLPDALVPTMAIEVAPAAVASLALFFATGGQVTTPLAILAGYGLLMVAAQLPLLPRYLTLSFSLGSWAFTFSYAAVTSATLFWINAEHPWGARAWSYLLLAAVTALVGAVGIRTVIALIHRTLLPRPAVPAPTVSDPRVGILEEAGQHANS
jgi:tellurite resistance protein